MGIVDVFINYLVVIRKSNVMNEWNKFWTYELRNRSSIPISEYLQPSSAPARLRSKLGFIYMGLDYSQVAFKYKIQTI